MRRCEFLGCECPDTAEPFDDGKRAAGHRGVHLQPFGISGKILTCRQQCDTAWRESTFPKRPPMSVVHQRWCQAILQRRLGSMRCGRGTAALNAVGSRRWKAEPSPTFSACVQPRAQKYTRLRRAWEANRLCAPSCARFRWLQVVTGMPDGGVPPRMASLTSPFAGRGAQRCWRPGWETMVPTWSRSPTGLYPNSKASPYAKCWLREGIGARPRIWKTLVEKKEFANANSFLSRPLLNHSFCYHTEVGSPTRGHESRPKRRVRCHRKAALLVTASLSILNLPRLAPWWRHFLTSMPVGRATRCCCYLRCSPLCTATDKPPLAPPQKLPWTQAAEALPGTASEGADTL